MEDKISIIVPIYKVENYIDKCIISITEQTYKNLEIILVDDGSPDKCPEICEKYAKKDNRIKVIHKKNGGLSDARNAGLKVATGKYIGFVDSDDYIEKDMYQILYNNLIKTNSDISIVNLKEVKENEIIENNVKDEQNIIEYNKLEALKKLIENKIKSYAWNKLYKKEILNDIEFPIGRKMEDLAVMYKIFEKVNKVVYTDKIEYYYLQRKNSILGNISESLVKDLQYFVKERYDYIEKKYPQLKETLDIDRIKNNLIYNRNACEIGSRELFDKIDFKNEYIFYKKNFKKYKNKIFEDTKKIIKCEYTLLYINRKLFKVYYEIKKKLQKYKEK